MKNQRIVLIFAIGFIVAACGNAVPDDSAATEPAGQVVTTQATGGSIRESLAVITILTAESGLGEKPLLQWSAVDGAAEYSVVVRDANGQVYWAWRGRATEVPFGGGADDGQVGQNAYLHGPMTWTVAAYDESMLPIAMSAEASLAP